MLFFFFQAEDGIRDIGVTGVQTCALPISGPRDRTSSAASIPPALYTRPRLLRAAIMAAGVAVCIGRADRSVCDGCHRGGLDRKSVGQGKRVDLGGRRII